MLVFVGLEPKNEDVIFVVSELGILGENNNIKFVCIGVFVCPYEMLLIAKPFNIDLALCLVWGDFAGDVVIQKSARLYGC